MEARTVLPLLLLLCPSAWGLVAARCPEGWEAWGTADMCYLAVGHQKMTFTDARTYCQARGGDLALLTSAHLGDWLLQLSAAAGGGGGLDLLWVRGENDDGLLDDNTPVDDALEREEPGSRGCIALTTNSKVIKENCRKTLNFICHRNVDERFCPGGWNRNGDFCYQFYSVKKTWPAARITCTSKGANLISILTWREQDYVHTHMETGGWLGLWASSDYDWAWSDGVPLTVTNWITEDPGSGSDNCVEMVRESGKWRPTQCASQLAFGCKMAAATSPVSSVINANPSRSKSSCDSDWTENPATGECYLFVDNAMNFDEASEYCAEVSYSYYKPNLVSIYSAEEQSFVHDFLRSHNLSDHSIWIGMVNGESGNYWLDGTPSAYFNFEEDSPVFPSFYPCIQMEVVSGEWDDVGCFASQSFICEKKGTNYVGPQPPPPPEVSCPLDWFPRNGSCYYFSSEVADWPTADESCNARLGSVLASLNTKDENSFVYLVLHAMGVSNAWLGLHEDYYGNFWYWTDFTRFDWTNWGEGEPGHQKCGEIRSDGSWEHRGEWGAKPCTEEKHFVCEMTARSCPDDWTFNNGKCYYVGKKELTNDEAKAECRKFSAHGRLINIDSARENLFFSNLLGQTSQSCWLGLTYDGTKWVWSDGDELQNFTNWNTDEPDNLEAEMCSEMIKSDDQSDGKWNNLECSEDRAYGCELYPMHVTGCDEGWSKFGYYCYWFSLKEDLEYSHLQAKADCERRDASLASVHSAEENEFITSLFHSDNDYCVRIGLSDEGHPGEMKWDDGTEVTYTALESFARPPDPKCVRYSVLGTLPMWEIVNCETSNHYVCKKPQKSEPITPIDTGCELGDEYYEASCYSFPGTLANWSSAKSACESKDQHLVVLGNMHETAYVSALLGELGGSVWLGLFGTLLEDGSLAFSWVTGEDVGYTFWDLNEPDPHHGRCVVASGENIIPGLWSLQDCASESFRFVCEYEREGHTPRPPPTTRPPSYYCLYGWERRYDSCYKVMQDASTWEKGEVSCASVGGHLASVADAQEHSTIQALPGLEVAAEKYGAVWVGLRGGSDTGYSWSDGTPVAYIDWAPGQPDEYQGREGCVSANVNSLQLSDTVCLAHLPFICEAAVGTMMSTLEPTTEHPLDMCTDDGKWLMFNDHCYKFVSEMDDGGRSWWESHQLCREDGGELASILTLAENYWLESVITDMPDSTLWVGGRKKLNAGFEWIDNETFVFDNWAKGEPNNVNDQEDCISMYNYNEGYWNDQNCGHEIGRICKRPDGQTHPPAQTSPVPPGHCLEDWIHAGTKCLYFITDKSNFTTSRNVCQSMASGAELASLHSAADQAYLMAALAEVKGNMWLGLTYESGFHWVDQTKVNYVNWGPGEPNGGNNKEECVEVSHETGLWNDISCSDEFGGVCMMTQDPNLPDHHTPSSCSAPYDTFIAYNGACYKVLSSGKPWLDAEAACTGEGAHLVSILSLAEDSFVWAAGLESNSSNMWVGLNSFEDQQVFSWVDGWPTLYTNWASGEPSASETLNKCVSVSMVDGLWSTEKCDSARSFMCKYSNETVPIPDPPTGGHCPDSRWADLGGSSCYRAQDQKKTWDEANNICAQNLSSLASLHSEEEMRLVTIMMETYNEPFWIGLVETDHGLAWSDGSDLDYKNWADGEPNGDEEQCVEALAHSGLWNDVVCDALRFSICKTPKISDTSTLLPSTDHPSQTSPSSPPTTTSTTTTPTTTPTTTTTITTTTTTTPGPSGLTGGEIAGIVIGVLVVLAAGGAVGFYFYRKQATARRHQENKLQTIYDPDIPRDIQLEGAAKHGRTDYSATEA